MSPHLNLTSIAPTSLHALDGREPAEGVLTRYNRRTVTAVADNGRQWNVAPGFLSKAEPPKPASRGRSNVIALR